MTSATEKLRLFASEMHLEPAEEARQARIPLNVLPSRQGGAVAPCGQVLDEPAQKLARASSGVSAKRDSLGIYDAVVSGGKRISLLKTMMTSACERNCFYCPFRAGRSYRRETFSPDEMANTFMTIHRAGLAEGMFLSSGIIKGGVTSQDKIIATAEILRHKLGFRGYLHLKLMPGAERDQLLRTMQLADRVSVNLEAPNSRRLGMLAPKKVFFEELLRPLQWLEEIRQTRPAYESWNGRWPSSATQFVVGAVGESDLELLSTADFLYRQARLGRIYFSAFSPVPDTPLENNPAENPWREHRLYQASFLLRDYDFDLEEMPFSQAGNLPLNEDPKQAWAREYLAENPVELNRARSQELLRVPGIGPKSAQTILRARRQGQLRDLTDLKAIGVQTRRPAPYVLLDGKRPEYQLPLPIEG